MQLPNLSASIALRNMLPLPTMRSCPTKSSRVFGRILSASGCDTFALKSNNVSMFQLYITAYALSTQ